MERGESSSEGGRRGQYSFEGGRRGDLALIDCGSEGGDNGGSWTVVSRRKKNRVNSGRRDDALSQQQRIVRAFQDRRRSLPSVYIGNIPLQSSKEELYYLFSRYGKVADVFLASQDRRRTGRNALFGFIRFNTKEILLRVLQDKESLMIRGKKLIIREANYREGGSSRAQFRRTEEVKHQDKRTFAQVVREEGNAGRTSRKNDGLGKEVVNGREVDGNGDDDRSFWLSRSLVGNLKVFQSPQAIQDDFEIAGLKVFVRPLGGLQMLLTFEEWNLKEECLKNDYPRLRKWFTRLFRCPKNFVANSELQR